MNTLRFEAASFLNMPFIGYVGGVAMFNGNTEQWERFHRYIGTPSLV